MEPTAARRAARAGRRRRAGRADDRRRRGRRARAGRRRARGVRAGRDARARAAGLRAARPATRRAAIDSPHGRLSIGVLLAQDVAVVPLVLVASVRRRGRVPADRPSSRSPAWSASRSCSSVLHVGPLPRRGAAAARHRGAAAEPRAAAPAGDSRRGSAAAIAAHQLGLSPAIGAFLAGMLLAESPFATQVRADMSALRTAADDALLRVDRHVRRPGVDRARHPPVIGLRRRRGGQQGARGLPRPPARPQARAASAGHRDLPRADRRVLVRAGRHDARLPARRTDFPDRRLDHDRRPSSLRPT